MEGPTPVSALIHAATMVTAGVYMVARCHVLFELAPFSLETVAVIGAVTAIFAATIALGQYDIKRVLAYSTVSQLGTMFYALGVGAFTAGIFHLMTHAFFKALLFLGAGSVIHALSGEQDMRRMGALAARLPWTHRTMLIGTIAIAGLPPLAGFFSKDEILSHAFTSGHYTVWIAGVLGAGVTSFYMFRLYILTFRGASRLTHEAEHHLHESPPSMVIPLVVLAVLSTVGGWIGPPLQEGGHLLARWLAPVFEAGKGAAAGHGAGEAAGHAAAGGHAAAAHAVPAATELTLMALSVAIAALGVWLAFRAYGKSTEEPIERRAPALFRAFANKYWVDELYDLAVVRVVHRASQRLWTFWDVKVVDGAVNGVGRVLEGGWAVLRLAQTGFVGTYALLFTIGVAALLLHFLRNG
jgi:NADH-quinone oxidoreductase subunit L